MNVLGGNRNDLGQVTIRIASNARNGLGEHAEWRGTRSQARETTLIRNERKFTPDKTPIQEDNQGICCKKNICTFGTWKFDVLWLACYEEQCTEHQPMKAKKGIDDKCARSMKKKGICCFNQEHHFHRELIRAVF